MDILLIQQHIFLLVIQKLLLITINCLENVFKLIGDCENGFEVDKLINKNLCQEVFQD